MKELAAVILAAGKGVRMQSDLPKVFHLLSGKPLLSYVIETVQKLKPAKILVVVGHKKELIMDYYRDWPVDFITQTEQLGTGHAVMMAEPALQGFQGNVLVLAGDVPLISEKTLQQLVQFHESHQAAATDLTAVLADAGSYGRVVRGGDGEILKIVEKKDASPAELAIREINTGTFCFAAPALFKTLRQLKPDNAQKEYYLTDTIALLRAQQLPVLAYTTDNPAETLGINTKDELLAMENNYLAAAKK
ncbi:hypothetical protein A2311_03320 [candidate division WOR-1 bacterium RIFOXYB2_FULL_48_7]|uniref:MobA-like NTP transferase domain-containing protein n=1 Tax=candidate division WOR-1 bacterium RIFOXYB2_FULL_48_7 TaxID=1802583 RepID=A0A1F4TV46_UNCSA|nr:MAG: hypothetical protein A2311_03320 [candidate division WOR-1 bacterium RIFOXYB2_FULL_48_7]